MSADDCFDLLDKCLEKISAEGKIPKGYEDYVERNIIKPSIRQQTYEEEQRTRSKYIPKSNSTQNHKLEVNHDCYNSQCPANGNISEIQRGFFLCNISGNVHKCTHEQICKYVVINSDGLKVCYISGYQVGHLSVREDDYTRFERGVMEIDDCEDVDDFMEDIAIGINEDITGDEDIFDINEYDTSEYPTPQIKENDTHQKSQSEPDSNSTLSFKERIFGVRSELRNNTPTPFRPKKINSGNQQVISLNSSKIKKCGSSNISHRSDNQKNKKKETRSISNHVEDVMTHLFYNNYNRSEMCKVSRESVDKVMEKDIESYYKRCEKQKVIPKMWDILNISNVHKVKEFRGVEVPYSGKMQGYYKEILNEIWNFCQEQYNEILDARPLVKIKKANPKVFVIDYFYMTLPTDDTLKDREEFLYRYIPSLTTLKKFEESIKKKKIGNTPSFSGKGSQGAEFIRNIMNRSPLHKIENILRKLDSITVSHRQTLKILPEVHPFRYIFGPKIASSIGKSE